eukprot:gene12849-7197_t
MTKNDALKKLKFNFSLYQEVDSGYITIENTIKLLRFSGFVLNFDDIKFLNENYNEYLDFPEILELVNNKFEDGQKDLVSELIILFEKIDEKKIGYVEVSTIENLLKYENNPFSDEEVKNIMLFFKPKNEKIFYKKISL